MEHVMQTNEVKWRPSDNKKSTYKKESTASQLVGALFEWWNHGKGDKVTVPEIRHILDSEAVQGGV
jgi:hypothetical protein